MSLVFKTPKSTLNTTTGEGQNIGYGDCPECPECPKVELSDVDVEYTENGEYTLTPEGDGFSSVGITVNIDTKAIEDAAYAEGEAAGIITGKAQGVAEQKAKLESATFVSNGTYTKEDGYNEVTVNVPSDVNNQTKNVTISSNGTETITADSGYSGLGSVEVTVDVPEKQLTDTLKTYTENGEYTITPQEGYDGFSEVNVSVQIDEQAIYQDGFNSGLDAGIAEQKAKLTSTTFSSNDTFTNEDGWNEVIVDVQPNLDVLEVTPSTQSQQFLPESRYDGFSQVDVNAVTSSIDRNIQPENIVDGVTILGVTGVYVPTLEEGTYAPKFIGTTTLEPKTDGFSSVEITVPAQPIGSTNNPFDNIQTVLDTDFEEGCYYDEITSGGIDKTTGYYDAVANEGTVFHIKPYLNNPDYDPKLRPEDQPDVPEFIFPEDFDLAGKNIIVWFNKANVSQINNQAKAPLLRSAIIYEINDCSLMAIDDNGNSETWPFGTLRVTENGSVDPTGYAEIDVEVNPTLQTKSVVPSDRQQVITPDRDYDGLSEVTVSGVTAAIDQNITASNIKDGVTILGVTGTYDPQPNLQSKSVNPTTSAQTVSPDSGYDGLSQVSVTAVTSAIDANIAAGNIKDGVTILGITGTYDPQPSLESKTASYTANGTYTITPSSGYDGMDEVEVTVNVAGGSGTQCLDWSSIGWDCNDVENSGLEADLAYTAQKKAEYEAGTISNFSNDTKLIYAPKIALNKYSIFTNCVNLRWLPQFESAVRCNHLFDGCSSLKTVPLFDTSRVTNMDYMFGKGSSSASVRAYTGAAVTTIPQYDMSNVTSAIGMFRGCEYLTTIPDLNTPKLRDIVVYVGSNVAGSMFSGCLRLTAIPNIDLTNVTDMSHFAMGASGIVSGPDGNMALTTVPLLNTPNVARIKDAFWKCPNITTLGGFTNLGKAFVSTDAAMYHTLSLSSSTVLTKESIMNVINNLAAPDDTAVTDATLILSATSYALLTEEDIAIATAKRWSVVSA